MLIMIYQQYAEFYDLVYEDKDYQYEAEIIDELIQKNAPEAKSIIEFGCGTGRHAAHWAKMGYEVHGLDMSESMLTAARRRQKALDVASFKRLNFSLGDIRTVRLSAQYDAVVCLFHVLSYQTTNSDLQNALQTISTHLAPSGVCVADFWYGPGILSFPQAVRVKRVKNDTRKILRLSEATMYPNEHIVSVDYDFFVEETGEQGLAQHFSETHRMRYFFIPELTKFIQRAGLSTVDWRDWITQRQPTNDSWSVYTVLRKNMP